MKFSNIIIELSDEEILYLRNVDWTEKEPKEPYGKTTETNSLCEKGVVNYISNEMEGDYAIFLTEVGKQIIKSLK